jgi:hypothetical protein
MTNMADIFRKIGRWTPCFFGCHHYKLIAVHNSCSWTFKGSVAGYIHLSFYECKNCGKRLARAGDKSDSRHTAVGAYIDRWQTARTLPHNATLSSTPRPKAEIHVINGGKA